MQGMAKKIAAKKRLPLLGIELGTSSVPVWTSPVWANVAGATWEVFNLTFVGTLYWLLAQIEEYLTGMVKSPISILTEGNFFDDIFSPHVSL